MLARAASKGTTGDAVGHKDVGLPLLPSLESELEVSDMWKENA